MFYFLKSPPPMPMKPLAMSIHIICHHWNQYPPKWFEKKES